MNDISNGLRIAIADAQTAVKAGDSLEDRLRAAMGRTHGHWLITDEDEQFRAAIGAVMLDASEDERERLEAEIHKLKTLSALVSGVPVDMDRVNSADDPEPVGLMKLWKTTTQGG